MSRLRWAWRVGAEVTCHGLHTVSETSLCDLVGGGLHHGQIVDRGTEWGWR